MLFYLYCFIAYEIFYILIYKKKNITQNIIYPFLCCIFYYIIHYTWKIYNKYFIYKLLLLLIPFIYIIFITGFVYYKGFTNDYLKNLCIWIQGKNF